MCGFYCITSMEYMFAEKIQLDCTNSFTPNDYKKNDKRIYKYLKDQGDKSQVQIKKIDETRKYVLDEINHNDLKSEKCKKTCKYLNYFKHLLILASTVTICISISAFTSLVCVGITISAV